jgi:hypothetical protein
VIDVFSFILPIYHRSGIHASKVAPARICGFALAPIQRGWRGFPAKLRHRHSLEAKGD